MKNIIASLGLIIFLTGCSILSLSKYDTNEYLVVAEIRTLSSISRSTCNDFNTTKTAVNTIYYKTLLFKNFSEKLEYNQDTVKAASGVLDIVKSMKDRYDNETEVSEAYCNLKMTAIENTSAAIQNGLARKPR